MNDGEIKKGEGFFAEKEKNESRAPRELTLDEIRAMYRKAQEDVDAFIAEHKSAFQEIEKVNTIGDDEWGEDCLLCIDEREEGKQSSALIKELLKDEYKNTSLGKRLRKGEERLKRKKEIYKKYDELISKIAELKRKRGALNIDREISEEGDIGDFNEDGRYVSCIMTSVNACDRLLERGRDKDGKFTDEIPAGWIKFEKGGNDEEESRMSFHCPKHIPDFLDQDTVRKISDSYYKSD